MRILVTGGAGFIGFNLVAKLLEQGHDVVAVDNFSMVDDRFIKPYFANRKLEFHKGDVKDAVMMKKISKGCKLIYHLASIVGVETTINDPLTTIDNIDSTKVVIKCALENKARLIFASSADVYAKLNKVPLNEDDDNLLDAPQINRWVYARVKALEETLCLNTPGLDYAVIRYFNSYGPGMDTKNPRRVVPQFMDRLMKGEPLQIYGDGKQTRSMCYIADTVAATIMVAEKGGNNIYNVGSDDEVTMEKLAKMVIKAADGLGIKTHGLNYVSVKEHYGENFEDIKRRVPGLAKLKGLGYAPSVGLEEGIRKTVEFYMGRKRDAA